MARLHRDVVDARLPSRFTAVMRAALIVAMLAVLIRLVPYAGPERPLFSDERDYDRLARSLASTGRYEEGGRPTADRPIGYPAAVAAIYRVAGERPGAVRLFQAFLDGATVFLLFLLLRRQGRRAALSAAVLWAAFPPAILYTRLVRPETAAAFLLVASAVALSREPSLSWVRRAFLGVLLGITVLVKTEFILVLPLIPFVLEGRSLRWRRAAVILAGAAVVMAPWLVRNAVVVGAPTLSTGIGGNLLLGNHPGATGGYAVNVPDSMRPREVGEAAASAEAFRSAAGYIAENPGRFIVGIPRKWAFLLMSETELVVTAFHPAPGDRSISFRSKARALPVWLHFAVSIPYGALLLPSGGAGTTFRGCRSWPRTPPGSWPIGAPG